MNLVNKESIVFDYKGIKIPMELDYIKGEVSFTEPNGQPKNWKFRQRGRNYLGGWYLIFQALQEATKFADERLAEQQEIREKLKEEKMINLMIALSDMDKGAKK